jgi:hypothetical protein
VIISDHSRHPHGSQRQGEGRPYLTVAIPARIIDAGRKPHFEGQFGIYIAKKSRLDKTAVTWTSIGIMRLESGPLLCQSQVVLNRDST